MPNKWSRAQRKTDTGELAATGTVIANAAALVKQFTTVTGADDAKGVQLPAPAAATVGQEWIVYNETATCGLLIYPHSTGTINDGSANASITIEGKTAARFISFDTTNWVAQFTANA